MNFTYAELARLNEMISVALQSGKISLDGISESLHKKVANENWKITEKQQNEKARK